MGPKQTRVLIIWPLREPCISSVTTVPSERGAVSIIIMRLDLPPPLQRSTRLLQTSSKQKPPRNTSHQTGPRADGCLLTDDNSSLLCSSILHQSLTQLWGPQGTMLEIQRTANYFLANYFILFALQQHAFTSEEAWVAFTINHLTRRARLWVTAKKGVTDSSLRLIPSLCHRVSESIWVGPPGSGFHGESVESILLTFTPSPPE